MLLLSVFFKERACMSSPATLKLKELQSQTIQYTEYSKCLMACEGITEEDIKHLLNNGSITYGKSNPQAKPYPLYSIEGNTANGKAMELISADNDSITVIMKMTIPGTKMDFCSCE